MTTAARQLAQDHHWQREGQRLARDQRPLIEAVREAARNRGVNTPGITDARIGEVLARCLEDLDLAVTALTMTPTPAWVRKALGGVATR